MAGLTEQLAMHRLSASAARNGLVTIVMKHMAEGGAQPAFNHGQIIDRRCSIGLVAAGG
jgi:hypothetical protein